MSFYVDPNEVATLVNTVSGGVIDKEEILAAIQKGQVVDVLNRHGFPLQTFADIVDEVAEENDEPIGARRPKLELCLN